MKFINNNDKLTEKYSSKIQSFRKEFLIEYQKLYKSNYGSLHAPFDTKKVEEVHDIVKECRDIGLIVLVGIGGSNLGTLAILQSLYGNNYNSKLKVPVLNAETTDSYEIEEILTRIKQEIARGNKVLVNCVSKSGSTTETIALFDIILDIVKYQKNYKDYIVCTTQKNSKLDNYAKENKFKLIHIEESVGGRYSVFSPVGILPLMVCGVNCYKLLEGAQDEITEIISNKDPIPIQSAISIYDSYKNKKNQLNLFFFVKQFVGLGMWYKQLIGESLGKEFDKKNKKIHFGITPIISLGSTDLHSMAQLFIGGPNNTHHQIISTINQDRFNELKVSQSQELIPDLKELSLQQIHQAIINGLKKAFDKRKISYDEYIFGNFSEYEIGKFMQSKMIEMMCLGYLCNLNPFDQPNVEEYKIFTKEELKLIKYQ